MKIVHALALSLVTLCFACGPKAVDVQIVAANTIASAVNATTPVLRQAEENEGSAAIDAAPDKAAARVKLAAVEAKWAPVWKAHKAARIAQDAWATALEHGGTAEAAVVEVRSAFCALRKIVPPEVKLPPVVVAVVCL